MRLFIFFFLLTSPLAFAQKNLDRQSFMIKARPVLNAILSDFYQMITLFPDFPKDLIPLIQELDTLTPEKELLKSSCPRLITKQCAWPVKNIRTKLAHIKNLSMIVMANQKMSSSPYLNSLSGQRFVSEFDTELEEVKGYLDNTSFLSSAELPQKRETYFVLKELDELNTILSLSIMEYIPYNYREDFRHFYFNFIHPLQLQISKSSNYEFVNKNVESLNFSINLLNMTLTKKKKTPDGMGPYLSTIHNRWNSLLRYYF